MPAISGVIITYNEEKNIARCIDTLSQVVDEIVVVDSFSKDGTKQICLEKGVRLIEHPFIGHIAQKQFATQQATHDIVLSLDADEYLSEELTESILKIKPNLNGKAYRINRMSKYGDKWIRHGSWYPDRKIRLWDRRFGKWGGYNPHDEVILDSHIRVVRLTGDILHRSYRGTADVISKIQSYSQIFSTARVRKESSSVIKILAHSGFAFVKSYFFKLGFLDGYEGLMVASIVASHAFYKYSKLYELNRRNKIPG